MADFAGRLNIRIRKAGDRDEVQIDSSRPVTASRVFIGNTVEETVARLPTLFSICAAAQASACVSACETALGIAPGPGVHEVRRLLVDAETVKEHLWRILLDWPRFLGEPPRAPEMAKAMTAYSRFRDALGASATLVPAVHRTRTDLMAAGDALDELALVTADQILGARPVTWLTMIHGLASFLAWCRRSATPAARLLWSVTEAGWAPLGASAVQPLPVLSAAELDGLLGGEDGTRFTAAPLWRGFPAETSPYTRNLSHPLVAELTAEFGNGLLARLAAQLVELATMQEGLRSGLAEPTRKGEELREATAPGIGIAQVPAARGLLVHRVLLDRRRVEDYRILAPTEWNFHADGAVARGLAGFSASDDETLRRQAHLLITAVDPCVDYDVSVC